MTLDLSLSFDVKLLEYHPNMGTVIKIAIISTIMVIIPIIVITN